MRKKAFYKQEQNNAAQVFLMAMGIFITCVLIYLKIVDPEGWAPNGFMIAMGFMGVWNIIVIVIGRELHKSKREFINKREMILEKGSKYNGEVVDYRIEQRTHRGSRGNIIRTQHYYALIKFNDGEEKTYWAPELNFDPRMLEDKQVSVHVYDNEYYIDDYIIGNKINKSIVKEEEQNISLINCIGTIIPGVIFTGVCAYVAINAGDMLTRIIMIPFCICGIGVILKGLIPPIAVVVKDEQTKEKILEKKHIGGYIYTIGFAIFWFGFLILADYIAIKDKQWQLVVFSIIFWIAGIYVISKNLKKYK